MTISLYPVKEQLETLFASASDQPVVMLPLLRFKERATAPDESASGIAAYQRYGDAMRKLFESRGGRFLWMGSVDSQVIGEGAERVQMAALVEYPSRKVFVEIATSKEVAGIGVHRAAGLEGQSLLATTTRTA